MATPKPAKDSKPNVVLRPATREDLHAITEVVIRAFPQDPQWHYRLPYWKEYPEDHFKYSMERLGCFLDQVDPGRAIYLVAEVEDEGAKRIVGEALWQLPETHLEGGKNADAQFSTQEMVYPPPQTERRDMNVKRHEAYFKAIHDSKTQWFDKRFGERQLYLAVLCIDPAYQGCGIGTKFLQWGIDRAKQEKVGISLFASPRGRDLYAKMGFKDGGWTKAQVEGEEDFIEYPGMYWVEKESDFPITET